MAFFSAFSPKTSQGIINIAMVVGVSAALFMAFKAKKA